MPRQGAPPAQPVNLTGDGAFVAPAEPGVYIYTASGQWKHGHAMYVFWVEVK